MFLLQILNKTHGLTVAATAAVARARLERVEVEVVRIVAIVLSGRPAFAVALHIVHIRAVAEACGRQKDCTCGFE